MAKLIKSNFARLRSTPLFWAAILVSSLNPLYTVLNHYHYGKQFDLDLAPDDALIMVADGYIFPIALAILISLFIGTEYSDKTIRNKLIVGHSRSNTYLSNLLIGIAVSLAMYGVGAVIAVAIGIPLLGSYALSMKLLLPQILCAAFSVSALASVFVLIAMLISNRAISSISAMLLSAGLAYLPPLLWAELDTSLDEITATGWSYGLYRIIYDFLPTCQLYQYTADIESYPKNLAVFPIYSILILVTTTVIGILIFKKKNLK